MYGVSVQLLRSLGDWNPCATPTARAFHSLITSKLWLPLRRVDGCIPHVIPNLAYSFFRPFFFCGFPHEIGSGVFERRRGEFGQVRVSSFERGRGGGGGGWLWVQKRKVQSWK